MKPSEIQDKIENGGFLLRAIIQMVGKPQEHVEKSLHDFLQHLKTLPGTGFVIIKENYAPAEEQEGTESMFGAFCDIEVVCDDNNGVLNFCVEAMPASVEVVEPETITVQGHEYTVMLTDFVGKLHQAEMSAKQSVQQARLFAKNLDIVTQNAIMILLNFGPHTSADIARIVGVPDQSIGQFLDRMVQSGAIALEDGKYAIVKGAKQ